MATAALLRSDFATRLYEKLGARFPGVSDWRTYQAEVKKLLEEK